jgi:hypothetical protein
LSPRDYPIPLPALQNAFGDVEFHGSGAPLSGRPRTLDNVQSTDRQLIDLQFADPRALDIYSADGQAANRERANRDRANGCGPKRECQKIGDRSGAGSNIMSNLPRVVDFKSRDVRTLV